MVSVPECLVQWVVAELVLCLLLGFDQALLWWVLEVFVEEQFHHEVLIPFDGCHEWRPPVFWTLQERRYAVLLDDVVDNVDVATETCPEEVTIVHQLSHVVLEVPMLDHSQHDLFLLESLSNLGVLRLLLFFTLLLAGLLQISKQFILVQ